MTKSKFRYFKAPSGEGFRIVRSESEYSSVWRDCEQLTNAQGEREYRAQVANDLRAMLTPKTRVYSVLRSVSSSGMTRRISFFVVHENELRCIDYAVSVLCPHYPHSSKGGLSVSGCGMDMGFAVTYCLGSALWPVGTDAPHGTRNGAPDSTGGYALTHEWI